MQRTIVTLAVAVSFAGVAPTRHASAASGASGWPELAARFVREAEQRDPLFADQVGIHTYDDALADLSPTGHAERIAWLRAWRNRIVRADSGLSASDHADAVALRDTVDLELFEDATVKPVHTDPTYYTGVIGQAIYALVGRHYAPADERLRHAAPRLRRIPAVIRAAEAMLGRPTRVATLQALDENAGNVALYTALPHEAARASPRTQRAIGNALPAALAGVRAFSAFLRQRVLPRSDRNPRVGAAVFDRELVLADGTAQTRAQLVADAQADFARNRAEMLQLALPFDRRFFPNRTADETRPDAVDVVVRRVLDRLAAHHPTRTTIFATAKADVEASERFLEATPVVVLPVPATLAVVPTPDFMAGLAGASLDPAGPYTPLAESYYYIDKIPATWSAARVASYLRDFNDYELKMLSIHEAVPGHYVQFRYNDTVPSIVRRVLPSGSFAEGWAVYGEGMMLDAGYGGNDPALRLFQLKWRLREEANTIIDAAFHTGDLSEGRCDDLLERQAYQERSEALTKWHRLQLSHDQLTSYFVGLDAIRRAEAAERSKRGGAFDVARFNAALLKMGSVEPRFIAPLLNAAP
ncbi:MAG: DUF885 domain-containing protein [Candidatus Eremiobacteraeota bacterium]|nr:DUF885 domain-containing protein [Candidatus Eremiobacteraeota bacterium]MBC5803265.1 DUF885 domain-containing protein [Candidatus Eremiobacteraeota bacterium]MBC5822260.1 DUF885 domain-containing protein [Candidatus Eremiobacteraeota bacterium]